ncbi:MAG: response regulator, partial [Bacteroidales bacterium]|nr:response regulator [Bacteroidales bacterium]
MKKTIKILIVEDSKTQAEELKYFLETNNYKVQHANDGEEALALLEQEIPDIIISDVVMPKIGGYELCKRTKSHENFRIIPVILMTSLSGPEEIFKSLACGADSFVTKPYSEDFLISKVKDIIRSIESRKDQITESSFEIVFGDQKYVIGSTRLQIVDLLLSTNENAVLKSRELDETNKELVLTQHKLNKLNENLEEEVKARTQRIVHLNAVLRAIRNVNQLLVKEKNREILIKKACKNFVKTREFHSAWIAIFDDEGNIIDFAGEGGNIDIAKPDEKFLRDYIPHCFNEALKTDDIVLIENMESDCKDCPWLKLHKEGKSGSMVLNLKYGEKNYGILNISLPARYISDKEEQSLFKEVAGDIAFALYSIELEEKRKQAEEELKIYQDHLEVLVKERTQEVQKLSKAVEQSPSSIIITDRKRKIEYVNPAFTLCTGYMHEEVIGKDTMILEASITPRSFFINVWRRVLSGKVWQGEFQNKKKNGELYWELATISPILNEQNEITNFTVIKDDITGRKVIETQLEIARKTAEAATAAKSDFLARMSHEIRTPLNAIIGMTHLTLQTELNNKQRDNLNKVHSSGQSLLGIINDILDFSKIEAGKLDLEHSEFDMEKVFQDFSNVITYKAHEKGLEMVIGLPRSVPHMLIGDPLRLSQIMINLANNAIKFTKDGEIIIQAELEEKKKGKVKILFSVKDTGIGLTKAQAGRLFQSFSQADVSTTRKYGGTGLGLSICKSLTEMMEGDIWVESKKGQGCSFFFTAWFCLGEKQKTKKFIPAVDLRGMKVLVCDDNETACDILKEALEAFTFKVTTVRSGKDAIIELEKSTDEPYELVLMDWNMPEMDGLQTAELIKSNKKIAAPPTIIMVTAYNREEVLSKADKIGIAATLIKPVSYSTLFDTIMEVFGKEVEREHIERETGVITEDLLSKLQGALVLLVEDNEVNKDVAVGMLEAAGIQAEIANNGKEAV